MPYKKFNNRRSGKAVTKKEAYEIAKRVTRGTNDLKIEQRAINENPGTTPVEIKMAQISKNTDITEAMYNRDQEAVEVSGFKFDAILTPGKSGNIGTEINENSALRFIVVYNSKYASADMDYSELVDPDATITNNTIFNIPHWKNKNRIIFDKVIILRGQLSTEDTLPQRHIVFEKRFPKPIRMTFEDDSSSSGTTSLVLYVFKNTSDFTGTGAVQPLISGQISTFFKDI